MHSSLTNSSNFGILKRGKKVGQQVWCPEDIVISKDGDCCATLLEPLYHLKTLVGLSCAKNLNRMEAELMTYLLDMIQVVPRSDNDDSRRAVGRDGGKAAP